MEDEVMKESAINGGKDRRRRSNTVSRRTSGPTRRSTKGHWTPEEDALLVEAVKKHNGKNWKCIAACLKDRTDFQCLHRWKKVLNPTLVKGGWTKEEDALILSILKEYGSSNWSVIARSLPGRIGKQCRERWHNLLNPALKKDAWTKGEEMILICAHKTYGNKWTEIAKFLPGRSNNSIKNHWNCSLKKRFGEEIIDIKTEITNLDLNICGLEAKQKKTTLVKQEQDGDCHLPTLELDLVHKNNSMGRKDLSLSIDNNVKCSIKKRLFLESEMREISDAELSNHRSVGEQHKLNLVKLDSRSRYHKHSEVDQVESTTTAGHRLAPMNDSTEPSMHWNDRSSLSRSPDEKWVCISGGSCSSIRNLQMPLMEYTTSSVLREKLSRPEDCSLQVYSPIHYSTPPNSPKSILRRGAESFETPSIIKRWPQMAYLIGFGVDGQLERAKHIGTILEKEFICRGERDNMVGINRRDMLLAHKFSDLSRDYLKLRTSETNEFDRKES